MDNLYNQIISKTAKAENILAKIDLVVYSLYGLSYYEIITIDPGIEKIISSKEFEKFEIEVLSQID